MFIHNRLDIHKIMLAILVNLVLVNLAAAQVANLPGTIAYFKNQTELHLTKADGSDDHIIWTNPKPVSPFFSAEIDWRPDGEELAFQSGHELLCSVYADDIWAIKPDGSGLRRVTNAPECAQLAGMPKGSVSVEILNTVSGASIFFLYVDGADSAKSFVLQPGFQTTITINGVSDFGAVQQRIVVFNESKTWIHASGIDVQAGQTVTASGTLTLGQSPGLLTAEQPTWKRDGSDIAYLLAGGIPQVISANPPWSTTGSDIFPSGSTYASYHEWSPTSDDFLVVDAMGSGIYLVEPGTGNAQLLVDQEVNSYTGISWMPDGSGFVFGLYSLFNEYANLYKYSFSSGNIQPITNFTDEYAFDPSVSPDGEWVAFTRNAGGQNDPFDLWIIKMDGSNSWKLADDAGFAAWGPGDNTPPGGIGVSNFDPQNSQQIVEPTQVGYVHGTNNFHDLSKATALTLPSGMNSAEISEVNVWFGFKKSGLTTETYSVDIFDGDAANGPSGAPLASKTFQMADINADDDPNTPENATVHTFSSPVAVGQTFFVSVNFGTYSSSNEDAVSIAATQRQGQRIAEDWEQWSDGSWHNMSDAWFGNGSPGSGTDGWYMWIEATVNPPIPIGNAPQAAVPEKLTLAQNYPNPFNPSTTIDYRLPAGGETSLGIYNILGQKVKTLFEGFRQAGSYSVQWNGTDDRGEKVASGMYVYLLQTGEEKISRRMILLR